MLNKPQLLRRLLALCGLLLLCSGVALSQLFQLQILSGEKYVRRSAEFLTTTSTVSAARGEILDRYGRPLVTNNTGFFARAHLLVLLGRQRQAALILCSI